MPEPEILERFGKVKASIDAVDWNSFFKRNLGDLSFASWESQINDVIGKINGAAKVTQLLTNQELSNFVGALDNFYRAVDQVRGQNDNDFANQRHQLEAELKASLEDVGNFWPPIAVRIIETNPVLQQAHEFEDVLLKRLEELEAASERTQDEIKSFADSQIGKARETAQGISVDAAKIQFDGAVDTYHGRVRIWVFISAVLTAATLLLLWWFLVQPPDLSLAWGIAYFVSIRLAIFGVAATVTAFSFGMVKANMQLREANAHRARLANSVNAFLVASESPQQRDIILTRLVEAVAEHPDAGFVKSGTDNESRGRFSVENLVRNASGEIGSTN